MTGVERFREWAPQLVAAAEHADSRLLEYARQALSGLEHYDLPIGWKHIPDPLFPLTVWVAAFHVKLESPNYFMNDWRRRKAIRGKWNSQLWQMVTKVAGVGSRRGLVELDRTPKCFDRMAIQVIRLVPSVREFLRDDDNSSFSTKGMSDALKDVGLIKDDRSEYFAPARLLQDVSPIGIPITLFILRPQAAALRTGDPHVHQLERQSAHRARVLADGNPQRRDDDGVRRRPRARAADAWTGETTGRRRR